MSLLFYQGARVGLSALLAFLVYMQFLVWGIQGVDLLLTDQGFSIILLLIVPLYLIVLPLISIWVLKDAGIIWWIIIGALIILLVFTGGFMFVAIAEGISLRSDIPASAQISEVTINFLSGFGSELFQAMLIASAVVFIERLVNKLRPEQQASN